MKPPFVRVGIKRDFSPLNFGTGLCRMQKRNNQNEPLWKRPNWFTDHFFDGHNSISLFLPD
jgi:hypothetical protein